jgi:hypothetical protein
MSGADLEGVRENLAQEQINQAFGDGNTTLSDHLQRPAHWPKGDEGSSKEG